MSNTKGNKARDRRAARTTPFQDEVHHILGALGEDPDRAGLAKTPDRIARRIAAFVGGNLALPLPFAVQKAA